MTRANHTGQPAVACTRGEQLYADYIHAHEELSQGDVAVVGCDEQCNERLIERFKFRKIKDMAFNTNIKVGSTYRAVSYMHCGAQDWLLECDSTADLGSKAATMLGTSPGGWCRASRYRGGYSAASLRPSNALTSDRYISRTCSICWSLSFDSARSFCLSTSNRIVLTSLAVL